MTTTTDETTHLRALLAEQTARAERAHQNYAQALLDMAASEAKAEHALAACAEMRAALLEAREVMTGMIGQEWADAWNAADTALSRPDLGAGMVVVPRERLTACVACGPRQLACKDCDGGCADLDALLKKGGG